ncbi:MAG: 6-bladed beta-propeller [Candidatus Sabulitectum sp.]|nr:6-bladed beta-propeller [Candidatus Sabulitectum sp.]
MRKTICLSLVSAVLVLFACAGEQGSPAEQAGVATQDTIYITAIDTIGSEFGEETEVFAFPVAAGYTPDGNIAVLDAQKTRLQIFNPQGEEVMQIGRSGQGPGEYQMPMGLAILGSGRVQSWYALIQVVPL